MTLSLTKYNVPDPVNEVDDWKRLLCPDADLQKFSGEARKTLCDYYTGIKQINYISVVMSHLILLLLAITIILITL